MGTAMMKRIIPAMLFAVIACLFVVMGTTACDSASSLDDDYFTPPSSEDSPAPPPIDASPDQGVENTNTPPPPPETYPGPGVELLPYNGVVEHLFFHEVIAWPELAFDGGPDEAGYDDYMITALEFERVLESLHRNGFILVDLNDVWSEYTNESGEQRMRRNTLMLPEGKKPLVFSFDDINFYEYMQGFGFMDQLVIGDDGGIWAAGTDPSGNAIISQDYTAVTILDRFIMENPDFSMHGVKGCIALTGYQGILGYRTQFDRNDDSPEARLDRMLEIARVRPVVDKLKETGWYFASHSYGHIGLHRNPLETVKDDAQRWMDEVGSLVGETMIFIYPFGSRLDGGDVYSTGPAFWFYYDLGFRIFASVGSEPFTRIKPDLAAVVLDRMNVDGITLRGIVQQGAYERFLRFYDAAEIYDDRRPDFGVRWQNGAQGAEAGEPSGAEYGEPGYGSGESGAEYGDPGFGSGETGVEDGELGVEGGETGVEGPSA